MSEGVTSLLRNVTVSLERYFEFQRLNTNWRTEILAGLTTFITMAYIVFVKTFPILPGHPAVQGR